MSAHSIFEHAPIGAIVAWSDGNPRPPERHRRKRNAWTTNNSQGRLIRKQGGPNTGALDPHASFTLHEADYGAGGVIAICVHRTSHSPLVCASTSSSDRPSAPCGSLIGRATLPNSFTWRRIAPPPSNGCPNTAVPTPCSTRPPPMPLRGG
jgi:hypothetical protein